MPFIVPHHTIFRQKDKKTKNIKYLFGFTDLMANFAPGAEGPGTFAPPEGPGTFASLL